NGASGSRARAMTDAQRGTSLHLLAEARGRRSHLAVPLVIPPPERGRSPRAGSPSRVRGMGCPVARRVGGNSSACRDTAHSWWVVGKRDPHPARKGAPTSPFQGEVLQSVQWLRTFRGDSND